VSSAYMFRFLQLHTAGSYTSTPPYVFMAWYLVKRKDNFMFTYMDDNTEHLHLTFICYIL